MSGTGWRLKPHISLEGDAGAENGVLFDTHSATMYTCNETAWRLLCALREGGGMDQLVVALIAAHDVTDKTAHSDALALLGQLQMMGLLDDVD
jgi:hypothetical protein